MYRMSVYVAASVVGTRTLCNLSLRSSDGDFHYAIKPLTPGRVSIHAIIAVRVFILGVTVKGNFEVAVTSTGGSRQFGE